ncbi:hypothetical protein BDQ17DRAFT_1242173 [Cyathus striatus]|nr:hypothetical protein BDQ17DRAFT_1242173 [Cyathus striatus]
MGFPRFRQREAQFCNDWLRGYCPRGLACSYVHEDKRKDYVNSELARISTKPPRPKFNERCRDWLRDQCSRGASCPYVHEDIDYDDSRNQLDDGTHSRPRVPSDRPSGYIPRKPPEVLHFKVHDHIKIGLRAGFEIQQVVTGFESSWLFISNVPSNVTQENIMRLLRRHGTITDAREIPEARMSTSTFKIRMSSTAEASQACANLNGTKEFGTTIAARLSVTNSSTGNAILCDTSVRITWELPGKVAYAGYPNHERAYEAIRKIRFPFGDAFVRADIHSGLPAVGAVTVRFEGIPVEADESDMRHFAEPEDVVWERPNYKSLGGAVAGIKRFLQLDGVNLIGFELKPPPYKDARALAWAHYATPSDAKVACDNLNHRKPTCTGMTRINARHVKSISYSLNANTYGRLSKDIDNLRRTAWHNSTTVSVIELPSAAHVTVKLCSEDLQKLGRLKMEMESILTGEVVRRDGKIAWDGFFGSSVGFMFLQELQRRYFGMNVERNTARRMIRLFGPLLGRRAVREEILRKIDQLHSQRVHVVRIEGRLIGIFMSAELMKLQERLGPENVILDVWNRCLRIRGDEDAYVEAREIVDAARQRHTLDRGNQQGVMCPVCLDAVTFPISLQCGHTWCRSCLKNYLEAAKSQKLFPLTCLGDEARCSMRIPLGVARDILPIADFEELAHAAFSAHVHSHPEEFHFCPTPDCAQVYRTANIANGALIQCPSCLVRICSKCHAEAHEGLACIDGDDDGQFKEWAKAHDVKNCPGCNIPIERVEGCNHVTCTRCQTHTCWVCMATFPGGEGIYGHMRTAHGGFGLGPTE